MGKCLLHMIFSDVPVVPWLPRLVVAMRNPEFQ